MRPKLISVLSAAFCLALFLGSQGALAGGGEGGRGGDDRSDTEILDDAIDKAVPSPPYADTDKDVTEAHKDKWDKWHDQRNRRRKMTNFADDWQHAFQWARNAANPQASQ